MSNILSLCEKKGRRRLALAVSAFAMLLYANTLANQYALDDVAVIENNRFTQQGISGIPEIITGGYWSGYSTNPNGYRPLSLVTFALEYHFFGKNPFISHLGNIVLYGITCLLFFLLLERLLTGPVMGANGSQQSFPKALAFISALLFAAHPLHTEVVANIKSRDEILCFLGLLSATWFAWKYAYENGGGKALLLAAASFMLALLSKENAVTFILVIPVTLFVFGRSSPIQMIRVAVVLSFVFGIYLVMRVEAVGSIVGASLRKEIIKNSLMVTDNIWERWATATLILGKYLRLLVFPHPLSYDYSYNQVPVTGWGNGWVLVSLPIHLFLLFFALLKFKTHKIISYSILYYFITVSLISNILFLIDGTMAERFLYIPSAGFCMAAPALLFSSRTGKNMAGEGSRYTAIFLAVLLAGYSVKTVLRNRVWKNNFTLFSADIEHTRNSAMARLFYGLELMEMGQKDPVRKNELFGMALDHIGAATEIYPGYGLAWYGLSLTYANAGLLLKAVPCAEKALSITPNDPAVRNFLGRLHIDLAKEYFNRNIPDSAEAHFISATGFIPSCAECYNNLAIIYIFNKRYNNAVQVLEKAAAVSPGNATIQINLGIAYRLAKNHLQSVAALKRALVLQPGHPEASINLSMTYREMGIPDSAKYFSDKK